MPLGTEVGLGPDDIVLDGDPAPPLKGAQQYRPHLSAHFALARSPISATAELLFVQFMPYNVTDNMERIVRKNIFSKENDSKA